MRKSILPILVMGLVAVVAVLATGCERVKIADINADPARYANRDVGIEGTVVNALGAFTEGVYEVDDGTGRIWVISGGRGIPTQGAKVRVSGRVNSGVVLGNRSFGTVLREKSRRAEGVR